MNRTKEIFMKLFWTVFTITIVLIITFFAIQKKPKEFQTERIALIDSSGNNYLFHGSNPFIKNGNKFIFSYDQLKTYFNNSLQKKNQKPLNDFYLIDVSLLDLDEYYTIKDEKKFFEDNPQKGTMINISTISPALLLNNFDYEIFTNYTVRNYNSHITKFLNQLHETLKKPNNKPIVIYVHCNGGRDRTGFITASYRMLFQNVNLQEASLKNKVEMGRNSEGVYESAMSSYCNYVKNNYSKNINYCT